MPRGGSSAQSPGSAEPAGMRSSTRHGGAPPTSGACGRHGTPSFPATRVSPSGSARGLSGARGSLSAAPRTPLPRLASSESARRSSCREGGFLRGGSGEVCGDNISGMPVQDALARSHLIVVRGSACEAGLITESDVEPGRACGRNADSAPRRVAPGRTGVACRSSSYGRPRHLRTIGPGEGRSGLLSTSGRFGAAVPVGVGDLDLSSRGWKPGMLTSERGNGSAPAS